MSIVDSAELQRLLKLELPACDQHGEQVEAIDGDGVRLRVPYRPEYLGTGEILSGPLVLGFADTAMFAAVRAALGAGKTPVIVTLNITFLSPGIGADLLAQARVIRQGRRLVMTELHLYSDGKDALLAHATATYALVSLPG